MSEDVKWYNGDPPNDCKLEIQWTARHAPGADLSHAVKVTATSGGLIRSQYMSPGTLHAMLLIMEGNLYD